ncbi:MAG: cyclic nucleotide-binding domain-containing protein [Alphaproteobacteria bacterium]
MLRSFRASQSLFEQGDEAPEVLRVVEGTVEVVRKIGRSQVLIDTIEPGGFVGALGPLLGQPRGATAQAISPVTVEALSREEYLHHVRQDPDAAEALIVRASARLRGADDQLLEAIRAELDGALRPAPADAPAPDLPPAPAAEEPGPAPVSQDKSPALQIQAASDQLIALIGAAPIPIGRLPFMVGRKAVRDEQELIVEPDLPLEEPPPHHISRRHFLIYVQDGAVLLRDLESTLGTTVNGVPIGRKAAASVAELKPGENRVTAGDAQSSYAFVINVT